MAKYAYPAVFSPAEEGGFVVTFPDFEGATQGEDVTDAIEMATDFLNLTLCDYEERNDIVPQPSDLKKIKSKNNCFINMIIADTQKYREILLKENNPIQYARKKAKLNIKQLADLLEAPYRTVQDWNSGKTRPARWVEKLVIEKIESSI